MTQPTMNWQYSDGLASVVRQDYTATVFRHGLPSWVIRELHTNIAVDSGTDDFHVSIRTCERLLIELEMKARAEQGSTFILGASGGKDSTATGLYLKELGIPFRAVFFDTGWEHADTYTYLREVLPEVLGPITWIKGGHEWPTRLKMPLLWREQRGEEETLKAWRARMKREGRQEEIAGIEQQMAAAEVAEADRMRPIFESMAQEIEALLGVEKSEMVRRALTKGVFPARTLRWCTQELKFFPLRDFLATLDNPVSVAGIRWAESAARAALPQHEFDDELDADVWRPIAGWSLDQVIQIHKRHNVRPNPLYLRNNTRVGCYPCIFSRKEEIAQVDPVRVEAIRLLEKYVQELGAMRHARNGEGSLRPPTFFQAEEKNDSGAYTWPIDKVVEWSNTAHGGRQFQLFAAKPRDAGCMRWGLCDTGSAPAPENDTEGG